MEDYRQIQNAAVLEMYYNQTIKAIMEGNLVSSTDDICSLAACVMQVHIYSCILLYTLVYSCIFLYTFVYSCIFLYTFVYFCIHLYALVYSCNIMYIHV